MDFVHNTTTVPRLLPDAVLEEKKKPGMSVWDREKIKGSLVEKAAKGDTEGVARCITAGANVNGGREESALHAACRGGHTDTIKLLLQHKADTKRADDDGETPLDAALRYGHFEAAALLAPTAANRVNKLGASPLAVAASNGDAAAVKMLLNFGADPNRCAGWASTPLFEAVLGGYREVALMLLQAGAAAEKGRRGVGTPLVAAAVNGDVEMVRALVKAGAKFDGDAAEAAAVLSTAEVLEVLLEPDGNNSVLSSLLRCASAAGSSPCVHLLLQRGADPNAADEDGDTPLSLAVLACGGGSNVVRLLLAAGADPASAARSAPKHLCEVHIFDPKTKELVIDSSKK